jgi:hypothetical protein
LTSLQYLVLNPPVFLRSSPMSVCVCVLIFVYIHVYPFTHTNNYETIVHSFLWLRPVSC